MVLSDVRFCNRSGGDNASKRVETGRLCFFFASFFLRAGSGARMDEEICLKRGWLARGGGEKGPIKDKHVRLRLENDRSFFFGLGWREFPVSLETGVDTHMIGA